MAGAALAVALPAVAAVLVLGLTRSHHPTTQRTTSAHVGEGATAGAGTVTPSTQAQGRAATPSDTAHATTGRAGAGAGGAGLAHSTTGQRTANGAQHRTGAYAVAGATGQAAVAGEVPDPEASKSFPAPASVHHAAAATPSRAAQAIVAPGAPSDAEVRKELEQMHAAERAARPQATMGAASGGSIAGNGTVTPPPGLPAVVARVIAGGNAIADFPYVFGGGHASFVDNAYDCSGSVSYALAAGGLLSAPETSGDLESWGAPGPGRWITVYANAGHTYMYVNMGNGWMRFDTSGRSGVFGSRWQPAIRSNEGFVARHWPGL